MALESFDARQFRAKTTAMIDHANSMIAEYEAREFTLTLRKLYYQFVARALIDDEQPEYKRLGDVIKNGRRCGLIGWDAIEDRTCNLRHAPLSEDPTDPRGILGPTHAFEGASLGVFGTKPEDLVGDPPGRFLRAGREDRNLATRRRPRRP